MNKVIITLMMILCLAGLAGAQTIPQQIIDSKISEAYSELYRTAEFIASEILRQTPSQVRQDKETVRRSINGRQDTGPQHAELSWMNGVKGRSIKRENGLRSRIDRNLHN